MEFETVATFIPAKPGATNAAPSDVQAYFPATPGPRGYDRLYNTWQAPYSEEPTGWLGGGAAFGKSAGEKLFEAKQVLQEMSGNINAAEADLRSMLASGIPETDPGIQGMMRFISEMRGKASMVMDEVKKLGFTGAGLDDVTQSALTATRPISAAGRIESLVGPPGVDVSHIAPRVERFVSSVEPEVIRAAKSVPVDPAASEFFGLAPETMSESYSEPIRRALPTREEAARVLNWLKQ